MYIEHLNWKLDYHIHFGYYFRADKLSIMKTWLVGKYTSNNSYFIAKSSHTEREPHAFTLFAFDNSV